MKDKTFTPDDVKPNNMIYLRKIKRICVDDIELKNQPWLWNNVIPLCSFTLFAGVGGIGKSQLLMFIAAAVSNGKPFTAGGITYQLPVGNVLILSCEDSLTYALAPRLKALEADTRKIHFLKSVINPQYPLESRLIALDEDLSLLREEINEIGNVRLIIVDPIVNFSGRVKDYINSEVCNFLAGLTNLAEEFNLAIILNKHLRKKDSSSASSAIDEISGSHAWVNTARQMWVICRDHEDKKKILFINGKSNIKEERSGMAFNIESVKVFNRENEIVHTSRIKWLDEIITISADEAINEEKYEKTKVQENCDFICQYLKENGASVLKNIESAALKIGLKSRSFDKAVSILRKDRHIKITSGCYPNKIWELIE